MTLETRSNSALMERAEQVKRWRESIISVEPESWRRSSRRIRFSDSCVFLAACGAGDIQEVKTLLEEGADIDTDNVHMITSI